MVEAQSVSVNKKKKRFELKAKMKYFWVACDTVGLWSKENFNSGNGIILSSVCHAKACEGENL